MTLLKDDAPRCKMGLRLERRSLLREFELHRSRHGLNPAR